MTTQQIKTKVEALLKETLPPSVEISHNLINDLCNLVSSCHDELDVMVDELKRVQRELERHHKLFYAVFDDAPIGYALCNEEGNIIRANDTLIRVLNCDLSDLLRHPFSDLIDNASIEDFDTFFRLFKLNKHKSTIDLQLLSGKKSVLATVIATMYKDTSESFIRFSVIEKH